MVNHLWCANQLEHTEAGRYVFFFFTLSLFYCLSAALLQPASFPRGCMPCKACVHSIAHYLLLIRSTENDAITDHVMSLSMSRTHGARMQKYDGFGTCKAPVGC